jgi:hypothetical protein
MKIIYDNNGVASILIPTPQFLNTLTGTDEEKLIHIANKDLATGTKYEIIDDSVDLSDTTFRNAWVYVSDANVEKISEDLSEEELNKYNMTENL